MAFLPYRYNPERASAPRVLATPRVYTLLNDPSGAAKLGEAISKCFELARKPGSRMHCGYTGLGGFAVETIWSPTPREPDFFVILGPGDGLRFWPVLAEFRRERDVDLLYELVPIALA